MPPRQAALIVKVEGGAFQMQIRGDISDVEWVFILESAKQRILAKTQQSGNITSLASTIDQRITGGKS